MQRDFCLYCGLPEIADRDRRLPCPCNVTPEQLRDLEEREQAHLAVYYQARALTPQDLQRNVESATGVTPVLEFLRHSWYGLIRYHAVRATDEGLVQLVYVKRQGSKLFRWPFK